MPSPSDPGANARRGKSKIAFVSVTSLAIIALLTACGQAHGKEALNPSSVSPNAVASNPATGTNRVGSSQGGVSQNPVPQENNSKSGGAVRGSGSKNIGQPSASTMPDPTKPFQDIGQSKGQTPVSTASSTKAPTVSKGSLQQRAGTEQLKPTEQQIVGPYINKLTALQTQYINQLYNLYNQARAEYHSTHESKMGIEKKYFPKVLTLENSAQDQLNSLLFSLRSKLVSHGYSANEVDTIRNAYYAQIAQMQSQLKG